VRDSALHLIDAPAFFDVKESQLPPAFRIIDKEREAFLLQLVQPLLRHRFAPFFTEL
jgi:hypothetical protein